MQDVLRTITLEYNEIEKVYFRQDNAGCYHSSSTILSCPFVSVSTGIQIECIDFSDPQGGIGAADRLAATCKAHIRVFINEGNDVTSVEQLKNALLSSGGIDGVRVVSLESIDELPVVEENKRIPAISKLNNFVFSTGRVISWRAYGIGCGKEIQLATAAPGKYEFYVVSLRANGFFS